MSYSKALCCGQGVQNVGFYREERVLYGDRMLNAFQYLMQFHNLHTPSLEGGFRLKTHRPPSNTGIFPKNTVFLEHYILPSGPTFDGGNYFDDNDDWMNEALDSIDNEAITSSPPSITMGQPGPDARQEGESTYQYIYRTRFRKDPTDKRPIGRVGDPIWP